MAAGSVPDTNPVESRDRRRAGLKRVREAELHTGAGLKKRKINLGANRQCILLPDTRGKQVGSYLGLIPAEASSGQAQGPIE